MGSEIRASIFFRASTLLLSFAAVVIFASCASDEEKVADFMSRGDAYGEAEQLDEAIIEYRNVLQIDPNAVEAHRKLAQAYLKNEQLKDGYWELSETVRLDPSDVESRLSYATIALAAGDIETALEQADEIVKLAPDDASGHLVRAGALGSSDRREEAEAELVRAVELKPDDSGYRIALAGLYAEQEKFDEAEAQLNEAIARDVKPVVYNHLANLMMTQQRYDQVESALMNALELASEPTEEGEQQPDLLGAYVNLGLFYFQLERNEEGAAILEKGILGVSERKRVLSDTLVRHYRSTGEDEKADELIERATGFDASDPAPWLAVSNLRGRSGDLEGALEAAEKAVEADPSDPLSSLRKAELLIDLGIRNSEEAQLAEADAIIAAVLAEDPSNSEAAFVRAKSEIASGDPQKAIEYLRDAIAAKPDWGQAHFVLGSALLMTKDFHRARAELARAVELNPGLLPARKLLVRVHAELGEHEYAIQNARRYLEREPEDDETRILMAQSMVRLAMFDEALEILQEIPEEGRSVEALFAVGRVAMAQGRIKMAREAFEAARKERPHDPNILNSLLAIHDAEGQIELGVELIDSALEANPDSA
ncbi:MAG: tetratricopeptide repeat protein, partial [Myxococcota bacterium]|nr:tetratricopeptide repeat protein [Myxococcota bacterium]